MEAEAGLRVGKQAPVAVKLVVKGDQGKEGFFRGPVEAYPVPGTEVGEELKASFPRFQQGKKDRLGGLRGKGLPPLVNGADAAGFEVEGGGGEALHVPDLQRPLFGLEDEEELLKGQGVPPPFCFQGRGRV